MYTLFLILIVTFLDVTPHEEGHSGLFLAGRILLYLGNVFTHPEQAGGMRSTRIPPSHARSKRCICVLWQKLMAPWELPSVPDESSPSEAECRWPLWPLRLMGKHGAIFRRKVCTRPMSLRRTVPATKTFFFPKPRRSHLTIPSPSGLGDAEPSTEAIRRPPKELDWDAAY